MRNLKNADELVEELLSDPKVKAEYDKLEPEFQLMCAIIEARGEKRLSQKQLAVKAKTTQAKISMIEAGLSNPTLQTVNAIAMAFGKKLKIEFVSR
ncbi:transcriptional regulator [Candidatus Collierbacteria bacterium CG_4_10_14_0_8_um_filter_43_86]|uniref:Transcriptional regulator n=2 Tax=Candidatus Collieribacteriota TaxID=1752725 RepID=A0A2H0DT22_9BACT|nr:MAG: transcriptional regulator [Candidatus Collierbacteria bacterium CG22_combo_CG10-13_8_21_14_all_43_12]PIZ24912.1 MAG: transcriptional regulator [Candidatus Collierbacteria bacterium CG_4_10_14_0_8_um_filter_43_86]PJB48867.1 MAG: transcriptional regulator [Candidatus Collierbacteria bacterium CG_4_9_14_3_um_filter_43_16]